MHKRFIKNLNNELKVIDKEIISIRDKDPLIIHYMKNSALNDMHIGRVEELAINLRYRFSLESNDRSYIRDTDCNYLDFKYAAVLSDQCNKDIGLYFELVLNNKRFEQEFHETLDYVIFWLFYIKFFHMNNSILHNLFANFLCWYYCVKNHCINNYYKFGRIFKRLEDKFEYYNINNKLYVHAKMIYER